MNWFKEIPVFEWDDLDGKSLLIRVEELEGLKMVTGYDPVDDKIYILTDLLNSDKLSGVMQNLYSSATELDYELCSILSRGIKEGASMTGNRYEELMDYIEQAESYLKNRGLK